MVVGARVVVSAAVTVVVGAAVVGGAVVVGVAVVGRTVAAEAAVVAGAAVSDPPPHAEATNRTAMSISSRLMDCVCLRSSPLGGRGVADAPRCRYAQPK